MAYYRARYAEDEEIDRIHAGILFRRIQHHHSLEPPEDHVIQPEPTLTGVNVFSIPKAQLVSEDEIDRLPLLEVSVNVNVSATISRTLLTQSFMNYADIPINKANYSFPLYDGSTVVAFRCFIGDDTVLDGKVKPKEEAEAEFSEAVRRRRAAVLLQEHTPEVFEINLGSIPAQTKVKVEVTYINELKADLGGDGVLVTIPTSVAARYGDPPLGFAGRPVTGSSVGTTESGLRIQVEVSAPVPIRKLECRTHPISVELGADGHATPADSFQDLLPESGVPGFNPNKARAILTDQSASLSRDFVLLILTSSPGLFTSRALVEQHPDLPERLAMMVTVNPYDLFASYLSSTAFKGDIIFVADRSGSMASKIEALKIAMRVFLKSLPQDCHFNICSFGSTWSSLWPCSREYSHETLSLAEHHIATSFKSDMGGTELLPALQGVVKQCMMPGELNTEIIVLTDGEVWKTEETIDFVRSTRTGSSEKIRFFALGIGDAVSHRLVEGIGRQGGGFAEVVAVDAAARWESRVIRMLKGALTPSQWQCKIGSKDGFGIFSPLGGAHTTRADTEGRAEAAIQKPGCVQAPFLIPSLHAFSRCSVYFSLDKQTMDNLSVINVLGVASTGEEISVDIPVEKLASVTTIHFLAAKALMNDLETGQSWLHAEKSRLCRDMHPDDFERTVRNQAETYGREWGITGKWTSFVAVQSTTQIEMASRIYRADRSELSDLTRQRYQYSYSAACHSAQGRTMSRQSAYLPPPNEGFQHFSAARLAPGTAEDYAAVAPDIDALSHYSPAPLARSSASTNYIFRHSPTGVQPSSYENTVFLPAGSPTSVRPEHEKLAPENTTIDLNFGASTRDYRDISHCGYLRDRRDNATPIEHLVSQNNAHKTGFSIAQSSTNQHVGEAPQNPGLESVAAIDIPPFGSEPISLMDVIDQQSHMGYFNLRGFVRETVFSNFPYQLLNHMLRLLTGKNGDKTRHRYLTLRKWRAILVCETIIVIFYIENHYASSSELWELVIRKARDWVQRWVEPKTVRDALTDLVRRFWQQSDEGSMSETSNTPRVFQPGDLGKGKDPASTGNTSLEQQSERPRSRDIKWQWQSYSPLDRRLPKWKGLLPNEISDGETHSTSGLLTNIVQKPDPVVDPLNEHGSNKRRASPGRNTTTGEETPTSEKDRQDASISQNIE
jgi:Vault protein inter-alpha-trypsin domain/von Willebrand factor type A domain